MKQLYMRLETLAPLSIRTNHAAVGVGTTEYIAGNTVLGSLAAVHRLSYPYKEDEFQQLFLSGCVLYPNLYPAIASNGGDDWQDIHHPVYPIPATAQSCKRHSGFLYPESVSNDGHGARDTLIDWALFKLSARADESMHEPLHAFLKHKKCMRCREPMEIFEGYYRRNDLLNVMVAIGKREMQLRIHRGMDRESGIDQESVLYNQQVFDEKMVFWGTIKLLDDSLFDVCKDFIAGIGGTGLVRVGTGRTRGMGKVSIEVIEAREGLQERQAQFAVRLQSFNTQLVEQVTQWGLQNFQQNYFFAITLHSPLILSDEFLRYRGSIDADVLSELLEIPVEGLEQVYQNASIKRVMGWQELWGTPRMNEYAIDTGSVFLFRCTTPPTQLTLDALFRLEEQGIGKRRAEGFGRIFISDPFHKEREPK